MAGGSEALSIGWALCIGWTLWIGWARLICYCKRYAARVASHGDRYRAQTFLSEGGTDLAKECIYLHVYIYTCVCLSVCIYVHSGRERASGTERER